MPRLMYRMRPSQRASSRGDSELSSAAASRRVPGLDSAAAHTPPGSGGGNYTGSSDPSPTPRRLVGGQQQQHGIPQADAGARHEPHPGSMDSRYYTEVIQLEPLELQRDDGGGSSDIEDIPLPPEGPDTCGEEEGDDGPGIQDQDGGAEPPQPPASPGICPHTGGYRSKRIANMVEKYNKCCCFRCPELQRVNEKTFVVISKRFKKKLITRYSATKAFFILSPWNPLRKAAVLVATNQIFEYFIILTIAINCVFMALDSSNDVWTQYAEYVFLVIYTLECLIKLTARGFFVHKYTYLRDPWNWLDLVVVIIAYASVIIDATSSTSGDPTQNDSLGSVTTLRTFRVFRVLKTISIIPGLKTIIGALFKSMRMLAEVIVLIVFCMGVFALFALQVYAGVLRQKCVWDMNPSIVVTDRIWSEYMKNESNWVKDGEGEFIICGNVSGSGRCPFNSSCHVDIGDNPNWGYTSFDNIGMSLLTALQLITLDFWEDPYGKILRANGPWNILFFIVVVFFGSFYLINLMLAVVSMSYEAEALVAGKEKEKEREKSKSKKEKKEREKKNKELEQKKTKEGDTKKDKKNKKNKEDQSQTDTNHLQVMRAINGSTASCTSLNTVGNGVIKPAPIKPNPALEAGLDTKKGNTMDSSKMVDTTKTGKNAKDSDKGSRGNEIAPISLDKDPSLRKHEGKLGIANLGTGGSTKNKEKDGYVNPLATITSDDTNSIDEDENDGDPPLPHIKVAAKEWRFNESDSEPDDDEDDELVDRNCSACGRCCICYIRWLKFQRFMYKIVSDLVFELFITLCIVLNVIIMSMEYEGMTAEYEQGLIIANYVFTAIFLVECVMKLLALSLHYFKSNWNIFDFLIVVLSLVDFVLDFALQNNSVDGIMVVRTFRLLRLLRIFKLAQTWSTMRMLLSIILSTIGALGNLTFVLLIVLYIFSVMGMQLFGDKYTVEIFGSPEDVPRWNFEGFYHSAMLIFRVICGEWIEPLWDCMRAQGEICMMVFLPTLILGNFMVMNLFIASLLNSFTADVLTNNDEKDELPLRNTVLNLFLALVINSFSNDQQSNDKGGDKEDSKVKQGWKRIKGLFKSKKSAVEPEDEKKPSIANLYLEIKRQQELDIKAEEGSAGDGIEVIDTGEKKPLNSPNGTAGNKDMSDTFKTDRGKFSKFGKAALNQSKEEEEKEKNYKEDPNAIVTIVDETAELPKNEGEDKVAKMKQYQKEAAAEAGGEKTGQLEDCFPQLWYRKCCPPCMTISEHKWGYRWILFRRKCLQIVEHKVFEGFIIILILASSGCLVPEDIYLYRNPTLKTALYWLNIIFVAVFTIEMLLKWVAFGFKKYFTSFWTILDFIIVVISIVSLAAESSNTSDSGNIQSSLRALRTIRGIRPLRAVSRWEGMRVAVVSLAAESMRSDISSFRALRTLRALRPLRAISRWQGMKIVVNALMYAIPAIINVFMVCAIFWFIFSIMGVQLLRGKFFKCVDSDGNKLLASDCPNRTICEQNAHLGWRWKNSKVNFDDVGNGLLALFQVATFEGWMEVIEDAVDSRNIAGLQPERYANYNMHLYFIVFIICGSFFTLNLFIGVIIDNFNMLKKKYEGGYLDMFLTSSQKNYYNTMKKLGNKKPQKTIKRPKNKVQGFFFDVAMSNKFELAIVILIVLNMVAMAFEHYNQPQATTDALDIMNIIFTTIFTLEAIVKIIGMRWHYFRRPWNVFDFIIVILSVLGVLLDDLLKNVFITPTLLRVVRVFRIGRVLRLIKVAKGIRKLLFALVISLPALLNIAMLLFLVVFIYAIFFMSLFGSVRLQGFLDDVTNFQTFPNSVVLLFRLTTAAGWNDILDPLMFSDEDGCDRNFMTMPDTGERREVPNGDCGDKALAALFMCSFILLTYLIIINMYIAVILENFNQAHEQEEVGITEDDFEMFYVVWERFDPHATQFIKYEQLSDFVGDLEQPLGIPKPNEIALVAFDLPIYEGDRLHCLDILIALVKHVLGGVEETEEFKELKKQMEDKYKEIFPTRVQQVIRSSTMFRKKEDVAAKTLQRAWRKHKAQKSIRKITEMAMEAKLARERQASMSVASGATTPRSNPTPSTSKGKKDRPASASSTKSFRSIKSANAKKRTMGNLLKVPGQNTIKLPSDNDA